MDLKGQAQDQIYEVKANSFLLDQYPNLVVISAIHIVTECVSTTVPVALAYLSI